MTGPIVHALLPSLMPGDFIIASYIGGRAVTFHLVERQETRTVVVHFDGTSP